MLLRTFDFERDFASISNRASSVWMADPEPIGIGGIFDPVRATGGIYDVLPPPPPPELQEVTVVSL